MKSCITQATEALLLPLAALCVVSCSVAPKAARGGASIEILGVAPPLYTPRPSSSGATQSTGSATPAFHVPPELREPSAIPRFPGSALAAGERFVIAYLVLAIDSAGNVTAVSRSPSRPGLPTRFAEDFFEAAREAVLQWRFHPALLMSQQREPDGTTKSHNEAIPYELEVAVRFTSDSNL